MASGTKRRSTNELALFPVQFPSGTVVPFAGSTAPEGWALCDGSTVSRSTYSALFAAIGEAWGNGDGSTTFNLPDMRGLFLRGKNNGRNDGNQDPSGERAVGNFQNDAMQGHWHDISTGISQGVNYSVSRDGAVNYSASGNTAVKQPTSDGVNGTPRTASETRVKNVAVNYIIKL